MAKVFGFSLNVAIRFSRQLHCWVPLLQDVPWGFFLANEWQQVLMVILVPHIVNCYFLLEFEIVTVEPSLCFQMSVWMTDLLFLYQSMSTTIPTNKFFCLFSCLAVLSSAWPQGAAVQPVSHCWARHTAFHVTDAGKFLWMLWAGSSLRAPSTCNVLFRSLQERAASLDPINTGLCFTGRHVHEVLCLCLIPEMT